MSTLSALKKATTLNELAILLRHKPQAMSYIIYKTPHAKKYTTFEIDKASGGKRVIHSPEPRLKILQKNLSELLQQCLQEIEQASGIKKGPSHAFKPARSIVTNSLAHRKKRYVFNLDLQNFFPSFNFGRVRGYFLKNKNFLLSEKVATLIAQIACYNNSLPQGSPSSPVITNLIGHIVDIKLIDLAKRNSCYFTRYADDITFSTNEKKFPSNIAIQGEDNTWSPSRRLQSIIKRSNFSINHSKTRMQYSFSRQEVTGLVTNKNINTPVEYRKSARAMVRSLIMKGNFHITDKKDGVKKEGSLEQLHGILSYIDHINLVSQEGHKENIYSTSISIDAEKTSFEKTFSTFLFYKYFYAPVKPLIVCEGKTDNIYLRCAIRSLSHNYGSLVSIKDKEAKYKIDFFKYSRDSGGDTQKGRLLGLRGGSANLKNFITEYEKKSKAIKAPGQLHPIIILIDNDGGSSKIFGYIKEKLDIKSKVSGQENFYHIGQNLYVVAIPDIKKGGNTSIEDFFEKSLLSTKLSGKTFNPSNENSGVKFYGKQAFAQHVVAKNIGTIEFKYFSSILDRIVSVIKDHKSKQN